MSTIHTGHDPATDIQGFPGEGCDLLLTIWDDGTREMAVRPGYQRTGRTWGPPALLLPVPSEVCS